MNVGYWYVIVIVSGGNRGNVLRLNIIKIPNGISKASNRNQ